MADNVFHRPGMDDLSLKLGENPYHRPGLDNLRMGESSLHQNRTSLDELTRREIELRKQMAFDIGMLVSKHMDVPAVAREPHPMDMSMAYPKNMDTLTTANPMDYPHPGFSTMNHVNKEFPTRAGMQRHAVEIHHVQDKTHKCEKCFKAFPSSQQLTQHMLVHNNIRKYKCNYCDKAFKQLSHLQQHHRRHTGERPYKCMVEECGKSFAQLSNLQQHLRNHDSRKNSAERKPYLCQVCDRRFATEASLNNHIAKLHDGIMMMRMPDRKCQVCGKEYQSDERYLRHIHKLHPEFWETFAGGRPLEALIPQREIQHREKKFTCSVCRKQYSHETGYLKHMASHPENASLKMRLWTCSVCQKVFTKETYLERHMEMKLDPEHSESLHEFRRRMIERQNMEQEGILAELNNQNNQNNQNHNNAAGTQPHHNNHTGLTMNGNNEQLPGPSCTNNLTSPKPEEAHQNCHMSPLRIPQAYTNGNHIGMNESENHKDYTSLSPRDSMTSPLMPRPIANGPLSMRMDNLRPLDPMRSENDRLRDLKSFQDDQMKRFQDDQMKRFADDQMKRFQENEMKRFAEDQMKRIQEEQFKRFQDDQMKHFQDDPLKRFQEDPMKRYDDPSKHTPISRSLSFDQVDMLRRAPLPPLLPPLQPTTLPPPPLPTSNFPHRIPSSSPHSIGSPLSSTNLHSPRPSMQTLPHTVSQPGLLGPQHRRSHTPIDQEEIVSALQCLAESMH